VESTSRESRFAILEDQSNVLPDAATESEKRKLKPLPICIREKTFNFLVNSILDLIGNDNIHVIPLTKGNINETKDQVKHEDKFRILTEYLHDNKKKYYTYQLKSSKGQQSVTKGFEAQVAHALRENGFEVKTVTNPINRNRRPQPIFKVSVEEPHKRNGTMHKLQRIRTHEILLHASPRMCSMALLNSI